MELKRISFEVAKTLKEAGYPQDIQEVYKEDGEYFVSFIKYNNTFAAPTYLEVWLWLWREKKLMLPIDGVYFSQEAQASVIESGGINCLYISECSDLEKVIIEAIHYVVKNDLIK